MKSLRQTKNDKVFDIVNTVILSIVFLVVFYPLYFVVIASFSEPVAVNSGAVKILPVGFNLNGYRMILQSKDLWTGYKNTIIYTAAGTTLNVILTLMAGYSLSRKDLKGRNIIMGFLVFTMYFNGGLIPNYLLVKSLGLYNTPFVLIILGAVGIYNIIIARTFFASTIPGELMESAFLDGCGNFYFFLKIALPLSKALVAVLILYYGVGHWNQFFNALIYLSKRNLYPLQLILRDILIQNQQITQDLQDNPELAEMKQRYAEMIKYGMIVASTLPILIIYPFLQKYFVKGVMIGAIKG